MKRFISILALIFLLGSFLFTANLPIVHAQDVLPVVRAVLFFSPRCPHCHTVMEETLPPLFKKYGNQLQIINVDVTVPEGETIFLAALEKFSLESSGVPFLVIGDNAYLTGSVDIPERFPALIESYLMQGGIDWPNIPGLAGRLPQGNQAGGSPNSTVAEAAPAVADSNFIFSHDPAGGILSVVILLGMLFVVVWVIISLRSRQPAKFKLPVQVKLWQVLVLCALGLGVAGYLTYIEVTQTSAVCGPVGDCNAVQQSEYARLFGFLPVGLLGMVGYVLITTAYLVKNYGAEKWKKLASNSLFGMVLFGVLFSIYLTYLEIFVIQAVCLWCLSSAVISTLLLLLFGMTRLPSPKPRAAHRHA